MQAGLVSFTAPDARRSARPHACVEHGSGAQHVAKLEVKHLPALARAHVRESTAPRRPGVSAAAVAPTSAREVRAMRRGVRSPPRGGVGAADAAGRGHGGQGGGGPKLAGGEQPNPSFVAHLSTMATCAGESSCTTTPPSCTTTHLATSVSCSSSSAEKPRKLALKLCAWSSMLASSCAPPVAPTEPLQRHAHAGG